MTAHLKKKK